MFPSQRCQTIEGAYAGSFQLSQTDLKTYVHSIDDLEEGERHTTANNHLIHLVQHVLNQLDLIFDFSAVEW